VSADKVSIEFDGKKDDYAVLPATQGAGGIDISKLMANS